MVLNAAIKESGNNRFVTIKKSFEYIPVHDKLIDRAGIDRLTFTDV